MKDIFNNTELPEGVLYQPPFDGKKKIVSVVIIVVIVGLAIAGYFIWQRVAHRLSPAPILESIEKKDSNGEQGTITQKPSNAPVITPGLDRPLTQEEKIRYGFSTTDDIWLKTSSPKDGSQPFMSFYNKTVNPAPYPTVPVFVNHK
jgi:hypothetical protein